MDKCYYFIVNVEKYLILININNLILKKHFTYTIRNGATFQNISSNLTIKSSSSPLKLPGYKFSQHI